MATLVDDKLAKLLLKKIRLEIGTGQSVLHISDKHEQIKSMLESHNQYRKLSSFDDIDLRKSSKSYTYVIADLDNKSLDDLEDFLDKIAPLIIRPGKLILLATNLCTWDNLWKLCFNNAPEDLARPYRAVAPHYLRNLLLEKGYFVKNRYWQYDNKLLLMADIPLKS